MAGSHPPAAPAAAEICLHNKRVGHDRFRRTIGNNASFGQHEDVFREAQDRLHNVLDHDDGDAAPANGANDRHHVANLGRIEAGQHFVEQQQSWPDRQGACQLESLAACDRQCCRRPVEQIAQSDLTRDVAGGGERIRPIRPRQMGADRDVLAHSQAHERLCDLESPRDAAAGEPVWPLARDADAIVDDAARAQGQVAGSDRKQRGLAGAVRPDERGDASMVGCERCAVEREQSAETLRYLLDTQQGFNHGRAPTMPLQRS